MDPEILPQQQHNPEPRGWDSLLPELFQLVAKFLSANEVACCLRPLCRSTASAFYGAQHKAVLLSKWAPSDAYAARWGAPGAMRSLTRKRREDLVRLTSASGSVQNLELAVAVTGCPLKDAVAEAAAGAGQLDVLRWLQGCGCNLLTEWVMTSAAASGHIVVCAWLRDQGCPLNRPYDPITSSAAAAGRQEVCAWLLANGCSWSGWAVLAAARGGHVALMDWLLQQRPAAAVVLAQEFEDVNVENLIEAAARGCPLPVLQRMYREWVERGAGRGEYRCEYITVAAAASSTPDWAAKVVWLQEEKGYPLSAEACQAVTQYCPTDEEVLARLTWLRGRGCRADCMTLQIAAERGLTASFRYLLEGGAGIWGVLGGSGEVVAAAAGHGHLACLQALHAAGFNVEDPTETLLEAAYGGHLPVVRWLVETPGVEAPLSAGVAAAAAESGSPELLSYLHQRGCPWDVETWMNAVVEGSEEMQEWLREHGCPTQ